MKNVWIVIDLGFGDAGKGATVDFLVRDCEAELVVRHHGGAQAGHNVVTPEGLHHTFSQFGSGTFVDGVQTLLGPSFVLHPGALLVEAQRLDGLGVRDALLRSSVDGEALVISPFQQAAGRLRDLRRGDGRHGTCGVGVGEAVRDALAGEPDVLRATDLADPDALASKLNAQRRRKQYEFAQGGRIEDPRAECELGILDDVKTIERTLSLWRPLMGCLRILEPHETRRLIHQARAIVFEGAQGVLLDQDRGFHPHTTWSDCTAKCATELLEDTDARVFRLGVLRTYMVRHGPGPFPTHDPGYDRKFPEPHNDDVGWQGSFRRGPLDLVLLRYALAACGGVDGLALTCVDRMGDTVPICREYGFRGERIVRLPTPRPGEHAALCRLGDELQRVRPGLVNVERDRLFEFLEEQLGVAVSLAADGPSATNRRWMR
jgi:adenylosuccinate synthase